MKVAKLGAENKKVYDVILITRFVTILTRRVPLVEQELLTLLCTCVHPSAYLGFKKSLKISKESSESVYRRTDNAMTK
jgi:hypothetical protein